MIFKMLHELFFFFKFYLHGTLQGLSQLFQKQLVYPLDLDHLENSVVIVTGGTSGLGLSMCRTLISKGAVVIVASISLDGRSEDLSDNFIHLDLASKESINVFVKEVKTLHSKVDILINNAGVMMCPYQQTEWGMERQTAVNFIGHAYLTYLLIPLLTKSQNGRVINISSSAHKLVQTDEVFQYLNKGESNYLPTRNYCISKLAINMYTYALSRIARYKDTVQFYSIHPGVVYTNLYRHVNPFLRFIQQYLLAGMFYSSDYASSMVLCKTLVETRRNGAYFGCGEVKYEKDDPVFEAECRRLYNLVHDKLFYLEK